MKKTAEHLVDSYQTPSNFFLRILIHFFEDSFACMREERATMHGSTNSTIVVDVAHHFEVQLELTSAMITFLQSFHRGSKRKIKALKAFLKKA